MRELFHSSLRFQKPTPFPLSALCLLFVVGDVSSQLFLLQCLCSSMMDSNPLKLSQAGSICGTSREENSGNRKAESGVSSCHYSRHEKQDVKILEKQPILN
ncbi:uncharacterized protein LOC121828714 [Peromyscus maniculatus bairdii]|uniref:uncharacterized protein LOC121828714 n=1 Tax=Peromyscus maniculatus bairdii TaxID=230844 RepID=UPI003FD639AC